MEFTGLQNEIIQITIQISSVLSIIGSGSIIFSTFYTGNIFGKDKFWNRIIFFMSFWDLCGAINIIITNSYESSKLQNIIMHFFFICSILCTTIIAITIFYVAVLGKEISEIEKNENLFHSVMWIIGVALALPFYTLEQASSEEVKRTPLDYITLWSLKNNNYDNYQMIFFFGPLWTIFFINAGIFLVIEIICKRRDSKGYCIVNSNQKDTVVKRSSIYLFILFITWIWGTLDNIQDLIEKDNHVFILHFLYAFFTPLHGFLNSLTYFWHNVLMHIIEYQKSSNVKPQNPNNNNNNNDINDMTMIANYTYNEDYDYSNNIFQNIDNRNNYNYYTLPATKTINNDYTFLNESSFSMNRLDKSGNYYMYGIPVSQSCPEENILCNVYDTSCFSYKDNDPQNSINITITNSDGTLKTLRNSEKRDRY